MEHQNPATQKARVFIGSSVEGKPVAEAIQLNFDGELDCVVWSQGLFRLSESPLESLDHVAREYDFAVIVVTADDVVEARGERQAAPRDNILFEAGYFLGRLGRARTFLVCPRDSQLRLPSDFAGLMTARYAAAGTITLPAALGPACTQIKLAIARFGDALAGTATKPSRVAEALQASASQVPRPRRARSLGVVRVQAPFGTMRIANISVTGALLEAAKAVDVGTTLDLNLQLDNDAIVRATARVVRVQQPDWGRVGGIGVEFTCVEPGSLRALEAFIECGAPEPPLASHA